MTTAKPTVLPFALEVHVALVESEELARLNSVSEPVCGLDLSALNGLSHRTRAVRLAELKHVMLTKPVTALKLRLDARELPSLESESEIELPVERSGKAHAIVLWHTMKLNAMYKLTTAPGWPNDSDVTVRQVVHYLWRAQPGDVDWAAEKKETAAAAEFAQAAAAAVVAVAQAAAALGTAVTQLEEAANEAADLSAQEAEDAEEAAKLARGRAARRRRKTRRRLADKQRGLAVGPLDKGGRGLRDGRGAGECGGQRRHCDCGGGGQGVCPGSRCDGYGRIDWPRCVRKDLREPRCRRGQRLRRWRRA